MTNELENLRQRVEEINDEILGLLSERGDLAKKIGEEKSKQGTQVYDPQREKEMLNKLIDANKGPFNDNTIKQLFKEIFKASTDLQKSENEKHLYVSRKLKPEDTIVQFDNGAIVGNNKKQFVFGPCSVESQEQVDTVAQDLANRGEKFIRGGAFKPRTSPYDFQGLGEEGLQILKNTKDKYGLNVVSEIVNPAHFELADDYLDVFQIGARNMQNFELLKEAGKTNKPVLLKRGLSATIEEFIYAAEYIHSQGNSNIILCERGIRTYEKATRNTLDISAVPILKQGTHLPVMVDVTHSTGRKDIMLPCAKAALAVGADGVMAEVHPDPSVALSDAGQQMDLNEFDAFYKEIVKAAKLYEK
ncbi:MULTISPECIES: bifunctional 3-deoxy-7-phosphoheptulonate synthase/chorismate mutase [Mammaliicoccus]|jgi:3-deoxy-7-phosphoheptulonate synthase/chorismate mutase|uniref:Bifunctional 3-deoxy-7-phosphoheptulonate synthase/chorismate mutase n=1 Tax=Mammaliicoccus lentus TaxID=42858 RepID=A0AAP1RTN5_MAMLE|nr:MULTISPECIES: bifunctional 3-deoxy-7-phosphoheptulonate synthase/chorismate mutase [Mammaliicoccus]HBV02696.1 3-deoxy-7-phosphoheptulonate synthase [Staphylococcus sp.]MBF0750098.1 bifunctional 3-deoxy-7-phosphoheptulonate synthase/chorismate mutase [Mammaliicoccus lentus]MBF0793619.1 bifunctional 3-deoxy-7-phosphoheptulonate synthase/chorismate mutase [Mammaliicoccus lentus]MBF0842546.1 bifunctional 3-deoxy-7-phosphoheptulonate synthase/chorismate mutase [Mammaliicoccus lentus]MBU6113787.1